MDLELKWKRLINDENSMTLVEYGWKNPKTGVMIYELKGHTNFSGKDMPAWWRRPCQTSIDTISEKYSKKGTLKRQQDHVHVAIYNSNGELMVMSRDGATTETNGRYHLPYTTIDNGNIINLKKAANLETRRLLGVTPEEWPFSVNNYHVLGKVYEPDLGTWHHVLKCKMTYEDMAKNHPASQDTARSRRRRESVRIENLLDLDIKFSLRYIITNMKPEMINSAPLAETGTTL